MTIYRNLAISLLTGALAAALSPFYTSRASESAPAYDPNSITPVPAVRTVAPPDDPNEKSLGSFMKSSAMKIREAPKTYMWESSMNSGHLRDFGDTVGEGPSVQNKVEVGLGDNWKVGLWNAYAPVDPSAGNETDLSVIYDGFKLCEMNGHDVMARAGAELYIHPAEQGDNDIVFTAGACYEGTDFDVDLYMKYLTGIGEDNSGFMTHLRVSRDYELWQQTMTDPKEKGKGMNLTLSPEVSMVIGNEYFGPGKGIYHISPGATLELNDGNTTFFMEGGVRLGFGGHENEGFIGVGMRHSFGERQSVFP